MPKYIDADALLDDVEKDEPIHKGNSEWSLWNKMFASIKYAPAADVAPVVHGRWDKPSEHGIHPDFDACGYICNKCLMESYDDSDFCPNCGALMDLDGKDEDNEL